MGFSYNILVPTALANKSADCALYFGGIELILFATFLTDRYHIRLIPLLLYKKSSTNRGLLDFLHHLPLKS
jgi:hypothetical protein